MVDGYNGLFSLSSCLVGYGQHLEKRGGQLEALGLMAAYKWSAVMAFLSPGLNKYIPLEMAKLVLCFSGITLLSNTIEILIQIAVFVYSLCVILYMVHELSTYACTYSMHSLYMTIIGMISHNTCNYL